ncbi:hypothetical protein [Halopseudomonas salegens]|uniref:Uncharacterized protein n=1 Tax=Halopseudomonas salegens TaxID=1434072 RepID=A0A1H2ES56_9GAMM|nr:hypothetical protein [Halopseudomonas salegens]SDT97558.1 hypothetical protein SAMN05216210_0964 [Halopseudomonas salegens]
MTALSKKIVGYACAISIALIAAYACIVLILRPASNNFIDNNIITLISDHLDQSNDCDILMEDNTISSLGMERLKYLNKYDVLAYSDARAVEQELNCLSETMSKLLYTGWLIKRSDNTSLSRVKLEDVITRLLRTSIILSVDEASYISPETLDTLEQIEFFRQPFRLEQSFLDDVE